VRTQDRRGSILLEPLEVRLNAFPPNIELLRYDPEFVIDLALEELSGRLFLGEVLELLL
jgi:hypothetical protein